MMRLGTILILFAFASAPAGAFWEKNAFLGQETQSIRVRIQSETEEGVLLMKHFKFGRPIYLVSAFVDRTVKKTRMVSSQSFFRMYNEFYETVIKDQRAPAEEKCDRPVSVTLTAAGNRSVSGLVCLEKLDRETQRDFSNWYLQIKEKL